MSDNVPLRLGAFGAILTAVFVVAWLVGAWVGPVGDADAGARPAQMDGGHAMEMS